MVDNRESDTAGRDLATPIKAQLQALVNDDISGQSVRNALVAKVNTDRRNMLADTWDYVWSASSHLAPYSGSVFTKPIPIAGKGPFTINHLLTEKNDKFIDLSTTGRIQFQALLDKAITPDQVGSALNTANIANNEKLDDLWTALQHETNLGGYTGFNPGDNDFPIDGDPYRIHLLINNIQENIAGRALTPEQGKDQLQALVNSRITAPQVSSALDTANTANNDKLDALWSGLKTALADYAGYIPTSPIDISDKQYTINLLITNKELPSTDGKDLNTAQGKTQLQALVNGGITDANVVRTALDDANNTKLDTLWTELKANSGLGNYTGFNPGDNDFPIANNPYRIHLLITNKELGTAGNALTTQQGKDQLQALVNAGVSASQVRSALNTANDGALVSLWTTLKTALADYAGYIPTSPIDIGDKQYTINLLITNKELDVVGNSLTPEQGKDQLQKLVNGGITDANAVRTALNTANNQKLDDLWTEILALFKRREYDPETDVLIVKDKTYTFKILPFLTQERLSQKDSGSALEDDAKTELQALVNDGITVQDIETYWNSVQKQKTNEKKQADTKEKSDQSLAIGLGTAGGVVALAGAGGFAYWFLKIRKS